MHNSVLGFLVLFLASLHQIILTFFIRAVKMTNVYESFQDEILKLNVSVFHLVQPK